MKLGRLLTRTLIGALFVGHGTQKLFGWFGGSGLDATAQSFESLGLAPGRRHAFNAGLAEAGGGALLAAGLLTPLAAAALTGSMVTAVRMVHFERGPWVTNGGYEYNVVLIAALFLLVDGGPGKPALDQALGIHETGLGWALASLAAGAAGSTLSIESAKRYRAQQPAPTG